MLSHGDVDSLSMKMNAYKAISYSGLSEVWGDEPSGYRCVSRDLLAWFSSPLLTVWSPAHKLSVANIINIPTFGYSVSVHYVVSTSFYCEAVVPRP